MTASEGHVKPKIVFSYYFFSFLIVGHFDKFICITKLNKIWNTKTTYTSELSELNMSHEVDRCRLGWQTCFARQPVLCALMCAHMLGNGSVCCSVSGLLRLRAILRGQRAARKAHTRRDCLVGPPTVWGPGMSGCFCHCFFFAPQVNLWTAYLFDMIFKYMWYISILIFSTKYLHVFLCVLYTLYTRSIILR
jgi:hypothetical protein